MPSLHTRPPDVVVAALGLVRLEVERLDHTASTPDGRTLRAGGRAWAAQPVHLGAPVLVAGAVRVAASSPASPVLAGPDGPRWWADFEVAEPVALAARSWAVEAGLAPAPPAGSPRSDHLETIARLEAALTVGPAARPPARTPPGAPSTFAARQATPGRDAATLGMPEPPDRVVTPERVARPDRVAAPDHDVAPDAQDDPTPDHAADPPRPQPPVDAYRTVGAGGPA